MNSSEASLKRVEVVADLPVLWATLQRLQLVQLVDRHLPQPRSWKGPLSVGQVVAVWMLYVLSEADHRLSHVQPWVEQHQGTLAALLGLPIRPQDLHDDRLADLLDSLAQSDRFAQLEGDLNQHTLRVYALPTECVRLDTTTASTYQDVQSQRGLIQFGHSKDDPDRPQLKVACAVLDPLGMPLCTAALPGNTADDPTYVPGIRSVQQSLGEGDRLFVGDCKMAALATRAFVAASGERYLCPLSLSQLSQDDRRQLLEPVWQKEQPLQTLSRPGPKVGDPEELVAEGFLIDVPLQADVEGRPVRWTERRWVVRSTAYAGAGEAALERRLRKTEQALRDLPARKQGKPQLFYPQLRDAAEALLLEAGLQELLSFRVRMLQTQKTIRAYKGQPQRIETVVTFELDVWRNESAIAQRKREMGWQVYATNGLALGLAEVVGAYRGQYRVEDVWSRMKGRSLCLTPLYLADEARIQGLVHLLSLAVRVLSLLEWGVRQKLAATGEVVRGLYAGQPGRKTATPSSELLLRAFRTISVSVIVVAEAEQVLLSPLTALHQRLLQLLDLPPDLFEQLVHGFPKSP
jgi:transposase